MANWGGVGSGMVSSGFLPKEFKDLHRPPSDITMLDEKTQTYLPKKPVDEYGLEKPIDYKAIIFTGQGFGEGLAYVSKDYRHLRRYSGASRSHAHLEYVECPSLGYVWGTTLFPMIIILNGLFYLLYYYETCC